jgi:hypothetical protein
MDNSESDQFEISDFANNSLSNRISPIKQDVIYSNRGSSYDIEECMNNMNSIANLNPRFAMEIESFTISFSNK